MGKRGMNEAGATVHLCRIWFLKEISVATAQAKHISAMISNIYAAGTLLVVDGTCVLLHSHHCQSLISSPSESHSSLHTICWWLKGILLLLLVIHLPYSTLAVPDAQSRSSLISPMVLNSVATYALLTGLDTLWHRPGLPVGSSSRGESVEGGSVGLHHPDVGPGRCTMIQAQGSGVWLHSKSIWSLLVPILPSALFRLTDHQHLHLPVSFTKLQCYCAMHHSVFVIGVPTRSCFRAPDICYFAFLSRRADHRTKNKPDAVTSWVCVTLPLTCMVTSDKEVIFSALSFVCWLDCLFVSKITQKQITCWNGCGVFPQGIIMDLDEEIRHIDSTDIFDWCLQGLFRLSSPISRTILYNHVHRLCGRNWNRSIKCPRTIAALMWTKRRIICAPHVQTDMNTIFLHYPLFPVKSPYRHYRQRYWSSNDFKSVTVYNSPFELFSWVRCNDDNVGQWAS